jgi:hypothetical protein
VGHAFEKHGQDMPDASEREFAASAMKDLNSADHTYLLDQKSGSNILFGNSSSGMVGYINTADPGLSTYFRPEGKSVEEYISSKIAGADSFGVKQVTEKEREDINMALPVDHATNFHAAPQIAALSKDDSLGLEGPGTGGPGADQTNAHDEPDLVR